MANGDAAVRQTVVCYFGVQSGDDSARDGAHAAFVAILDQLSLPGGPQQVDRARYVDDAGYETTIAIAYWTDAEQFERWLGSPAVDGWWEDPARLSGPIGTFREVLSPTADRFETLFSSPNHPEALAAAIGGLDPEDVEEHSYWGSMRERFAAAQDDPLDPPATHIQAEPAPSARPTLGCKVEVPAYGNIAMIRSGQDWSDTSGEERRLYLGHIEPRLAEGMAFLCREGGGIGCLANRYMREIDEHGHVVEKSFGMSYWTSLAAMEAWAEHHPTHLAIFNGFHAMAAKLEFQLDLRLYHEVLVLEPAQQAFDYYNCHPNTGLLSGG